jgi:hypothetical protein
MPTISLNRWCRFFLTSKLLPGVAMKRSPALRHDRQQAVRLGDGFAVVSAGEALETDEVAIVSDNVGPIICQPRYPQRWIEQITKAGREQLALRRRCLSEGRSRGECHASIDNVGCSCRDRHRRRGLFLGPCRSLSRVGVVEEREARARKLAGPFLGRTKRGHCENQKGPLTLRRDEWGQCPRACVG